MPKRDLYASLPPTEGYTGSHNSTIRFRTALALATMQAFRPAPGRGRSRSCRALSRAGAVARVAARRAPRPLLALLMRDITFGPEQTRTIWTNEGVYPLLDRGLRPDPRLR